MGSSLDVLIIQSHPHAADDAETALVAAGHRVHSCYEPGNEGFPCKGLLDPGGCPLDRGMDVALLVRARVSPRPSSLENGAVCAVRAGIPLAERGSAVLDPFEPWISLRLDRHEDVVEGCESAVELAHDPMRQEILTNLAAVLERAGRPVDALTCSIERAGSRLLVKLGGPEVDRRTQQALALSVLSTVQAARRVADPLDVTYSAAA